MANRISRIAIVSPACRIDQQIADRTKELAAGRFGQAVQLNFHRQCFESYGHFAGSDEERAAAFVEVANAAENDAIWFAAGGYGSCRILELALPHLNARAREKTYLGYSDMGTLLGALYAHGIGEVAHGPMPADLRRANGEIAILRALEFLCGEARATLEPSVGTAPTAAYNMSILCQVLGTPFAPDLAGHVLMLEETGEYHYRIDRMMFQITTNPAMRRLAGIRLGRCDPIPENDRPFGVDEVAIMEHWSRVSGIPYLGRADIGHDPENKIVPFGAVRRV